MVNGNGNGNINGNGYDNDNCNGNRLTDLKTGICSKHCVFVHLRLFWYFGHTFTTSS